MKQNETDKGPNSHPQSKGYLLLHFNDHPAARREHRASSFQVVFFFFSWQYQHYWYCL